MTFFPLGAISEWFSGAVAWASSLIPPQPPPEGVHPLVIHFPIALLLTAAPFAVLGALLPRRGWWLRVSALILLVLGTTSAFVSVSTGLSARDVVEKISDKAGWEVLEKHEDLTTTARNLFAAVTIAYAVLIVLPWAWSALCKPQVHVPLHLIFVGLLMGSNLLLANAAHLGGRLVHEFGVRSALGGESSHPAESEAAAESEPKAKERAVPEPKAEGVSEAEGKAKVPAESETKAAGMSEAEGKTKEPAEPGTPAKKDAQPQP